MPKCHYLWIGFPQKGLNCLPGEQKPGWQQRKVGEGAKLLREQRRECHFILSCRDSAPSSTMPGVLKGGALKVQFPQRINLEASAGPHGGQHTWRIGERDPRHPATWHPSFPQSTCFLLHAAMPASHNPWHHLAKRPSGLCRAGICTAASSTVERASNSVCEEYVLGA